MKLDSSIMSSQTKKPLTTEDDQHRLPVEDHFRSILRDTSVQFSIASSLGAPPSFQANDMDNWMTKKFTKVKEDRHWLKNKLAFQGTHHYPGTANGNA